MKITQIYLFVFVMLACFMITSTLSINVQSNSSYLKGNFEYDLNWQTAGWPSVDHSGYDLLPIEKVFTTYDVYIEGISMPPIINGNYQKGNVVLYGPTWPDVNGTIAFDNRNYAGIHVDSFHNGNFKDYNSGISQYIYDPFTARWVWDSINPGRLLLAEWDSCWLNENGTIGRIHHSDYTDNHSSVRNYWETNGLIIQGKWWDAYNFCNDINDTVGPERNHTVLWIENMYINGSSRSNPIYGTSNFMNIPPHIYIPILFRETYNLRADFNYVTVYQTVPDTNPLPYYPNAYDNFGGKSFNLSNNLTLDGSGAIYVDREQLDQFMINATSPETLNLTQRAEFYAWSLMFKERVTGLYDRISIINDHPEINRNSESQSARGKAFTALNISETYLLNATDSLKNNYSTDTALINLANSWTTYEAGNYYFASSEIYLDSQLDIESSERAIRVEIAKAFNDEVSNIPLDEQNSELSAFETLEPNYLTVYNPDAKQTILGSNKFIPTNIAPILTDMISYIIPIAGVLMFSIAGALLYERSFNKNVFLLTLAVGIGILVWIPALPVFMLSISALLLGLIIFSDAGGDDR